MQEKKRQIVQRQHASSRLVSFLLIGESRALREFLDPEEWLKVWISLRQSRAGHEAINLFLRARLEMILPRYSGRTVQNTVLRELGNAGGLGVVRLNDCRRPPTLEKWTALLHANRTSLQSLTMQFVDSNDWSLDEYVQTLAQVDTLRAWTWTQPYDTLSYASTEELHFPDLQTCTLVFQVPWQDDQVRNFCRKFPKLRHLGLTLALGWQRILVATSECKELETFRAVMTPAAGPDRLSEADMNRLYELQGLPALFKSLPKVFAQKTVSVRF